MPAETADTLAELHRRVEALRPTLLRLAVRIHFLVCKACPIFAQEVQTMRHALGGWRHYSEHDEDQPLS
ncbi:hypothetical protein [Thiomonas sp. X19]|uniref:hypothetical protein n=1 Tax=Thiomonas sp. X19 TaxID=1050370 RepID=UPI0011BE93EB|nr:hypothetical protein [Thiomonas sp. X19]